MGAQRLAEFFVWDAEDGAVMDPRQGEESRFDLRRINVNPAGNQHVVLAVAEKEVAVLIEIADVADRNEPVALDLEPPVGQTVIGEVRPAG